MKYVYIYILSVINAFVICRRRIKT